MPKTYDMNAAFMSLQLHERGIHVVWTGDPDHGGRESRITGVCWERTSIGSRLGMG
jgi:hypothetical protein